MASTVAPLNPIRHGSAEKWNGRVEAGDGATESVMSFQVRQQPTKADEERELRSEILEQDDVNTWRA